MQLKIRKNHPVLDIFCMKTNILHTLFYLGKLKSVTYFCIETFQKKRLSRKSGRVKKVDGKGMNVVEKKATNGHGYTGLMAKFRLNYRAI